MNSVKPSQMRERMFCSPVKLVYKVSVFLASVFAAMVHTPVEAYSCHKDNMPDSVTVSAAVGGVAAVGEPIGQWIDLSSTHYWKCKKMGIGSISSSRLYYTSPDLSPSSKGFVGGIGYFIYPGGLVGIQVQSVMSGEGSSFAGQDLLIPSSESQGYVQTTVALKMRVIKLSAFVPSSISIPITINGVVCFATSGLGCNNVWPNRTIDLTINIATSLPEEPAPPAPPAPPSSCIAGVSSPVIDFGIFHTYQLPEEGDVTPPVSFNMYINCPPEYGYSPVKYRFWPAQGYPLGNGILPLQKTSTAYGIAVQILNGENGNIPLMYSSDFTDNFYWVPYSPSTGGNHSIPLRARVMRTDYSIGSGNIIAQMYMIVEHE